MKYFTIKELCKSSTADKLGIDNSPSKEIEKNLISLIDNCLDIIRESFGEPIKVNSGYRCPELNTAVKGSKTSAHVKGMAADLDSKDNKKLWDTIIELNKRGIIEFRQLIWEKGNDQAPAWIHIEYNPGNNKNQILRIR